MMMPAMVAGLWLETPPAVDSEAAPFPALGAGEGELLRVGEGLSVGAAEGALVTLAGTNTAEGAALDTGEAEGVEAGADEGAAVGAAADAESPRDPDDCKGPGAGDALAATGAREGLDTAATPVGGTVGAVTVGRALAVGRPATGAATGSAAKLLVVGRRVGKGEGTPGFVPQ